MYQFYPGQYFAKLLEDEYFVFGSNTSGVHGRGAAYYAKMKLGAIQGQAIGPQGRCYAIPTREIIHKEFRTLSVERIGVYVDAFRRYTLTNPDKHFLVTPIATGLAGLDDKDIAPLFKGCINCRFSDAWSSYLNN